MTTDIAVAEDQYAPAIGSGATAGAALGVLDMYADAIDRAYNFAEKLCRTPLVGNVYRGKPADAAVAILYGAELGLNPIQSLQQIFTVHGTPAIYARTMVALLKRRGYRFQTVESTDDHVTVTGTSPNGDTETITWTIERAERAGYVPQIDERTGDFKKNSNGKLVGNEKYLSDPQAMLYAKAAAEVCRKLAPDVLLGISRSHEDLESEPEPGPLRVQSERVSAADILDGEHVDATTPAGSQGGEFRVQQWQAPEAPSDSSAETDNEQVETPTQDDEPATEAPSKEQITALGAALKGWNKRTRKAQLEYLSGEFGREITDPAQLTAEECAWITKHLVETLEARVGEVAPAEGDADSQLPIDGAEGGDQ